MSEILEALNNLYKSIDGLEKLSLTPRAVPQPVAAPPQSDLFGKGKAPAVDPALLMKSLDSMIGKIELVLKEA